MIWIDPDRLKLIRDSVFVVEKGLKSPWLICSGLAVPRDTSLALLFFFQARWFKSDLLGSSPLLKSSALVSHMLGSIQFIPYIP